MNRGPVMQPMIPFTQTVKWLIGINVAIWLFGILIFQRMILGSDILFYYFGFVPERVINGFWIWQFFTYMFLHSASVFHVLFNMLSIWWFGAELELRWGRRFFLTYYMVCGVGAAFIYLVCLLIYYFATNQFLPLQVPVVGASGAVFGILLAYGLIFVERVIYFMMLFPMKAKYFVMVIGLVEFVTMLDAGVSGQVANLAHLGGLASGFLFLTGWARWQARRRMGGGTGRSGRKLRLVVDNEKPKDNGQEPKYWN